MSIKKVMLAVGTEDEERTERLAEEAIAVAEPAGAEVVLTHVFTDEEFDTVRSRLGVDETSEGSTPDAVAERHTTTRALSEALTEAGVSHSVRVPSATTPTRSSRRRLRSVPTASSSAVAAGRRPGRPSSGASPKRVLLSSPCPVTFVRSAS